MKTFNSGNLKHLWLLQAFLCFLIVGEVHAGTPFYSTLSMRDGLPSNILNSMAQDEYGFLWIATGSGLARYDGYNFRTFSRNDSPHSLPSNELSAIIAHGDYVWVGTWGGLCKVNVKTFEVTRISLGENKSIRALHKGSGDILWVGTGDGLYKYDLGTSRFVHYTSVNSGLSHNMVRTIYEDSRENVWVGTYDKLNKLPAGGDRFVTLELKGTYRPSLGNHLVLDIKPADQDQRVLWIGTETGLYRFDTKYGTFDHFNEANAGFSNEVIKSIFVDREDKLWLGTDFGLNIFDPVHRTNEINFHNPSLSSSIANNVVWQIFEDNGGVIWFVTSNGLSRINKYGNFYDYHEVSYVVRDQLIGNQVKSILVTRDGNYWLATQQGVIRIDPRTGVKKVFDTNSPENEQLLLNNVYALAEDIHGQVWIGTAGGINVWDGEKMLSVTANTGNGLTSNYIGKFSQTPEGSLWVSVWEGGLYRMDGDLRKPGAIRFQQVPGLVSGSEKHVYGGGFIWLIEYDKLYRIDPENLLTRQVTSFHEASGDKMIYSIYFSEHGMLWAGTQNGLVQYDPEMDQAVLHTVQRASEAAINSIIEDSKGFIWSTTNNSLQKLNVSTRQMDILPLDNNLPLKSFFYGCAARTKDGTLIFGGDNGYIDFAPSAVVRSDYDPKVYVTSLEVNNRTVSRDSASDIHLATDVAFLKDLHLAYAQRSVTFEFSSLHFWQPEMNLYSYMLEGFEEEWNYVSGRKNFAVYSNLPPGEYTFRVRGTNNYGMQSDQEATILLTVDPPVFLQPGFLILYAVVIIGLIWFGLRTYSGSVHLRNELRIAKMAKEHAEELEHTKERFFTNISHELRTPISLILPPIKELRKNVDLDPDNNRLMELAEKYAQRLLRLVNQILDFNKMEGDTLQVNVSDIELVSFCYEVYSLFSYNARQHDIDFIFRSEVAEQYGWVDGEKLETVLFNLLSNAFKFTPKGGRIAVELLVHGAKDGYSDGMMEIVVTDSGVGIPQEDQAHIFDRFYQAEAGKRKDSSSGIGLTLAAEYLKLHNGSITVESEPGEGTTFHVCLPLGKGHYPIDGLQGQQEISLIAKRNTVANGTYQFDLDCDKPLILIIDDNSDITEFIRNSLGRRFNFILAENGEEGLKKAQNFLPQVIVSDIMMPVMDGIDLSRKIKENPKTCHIAIILLTAKTLQAQRIEGIRTGADAYLTKPFDIDLLEAHIDHLVNRREELEAYFRQELTIFEVDSENNEDQRFVRQVMDTIEANIADPSFGVEKIASEVGISTTHLYRKMKQLTKHSPKEIIKKYRIKKASLMLRNKEGNINEIMYEVGFSNTSYFSKCFRKEMGMTPKEYQQAAASDSLPQMSHWLAE